MKKLCSIILVALLLMVMPAALAEAVDVTGFWYSEEDGTGLELKDGVAELSDEEGEMVAEGTYVIDGANVTIDAAGEMLKGVVDGNSMTINGGEKILIRDGMEVGYWYNLEDDTALELSDGEVWKYNEDSDEIAKGTYTVEGDSVIIQMDGKTLRGTVSEDELVIDGVVYILL